jgi:hypothetical protein
MPQPVEPNMTSWFKQLDDLLRGQVTLPERLAEGRVDLSLRRFVPLAVLLGASYGFFMGWYALSVYWGGTRPDPHRCWQVVASMVKLPALFLLTLLVTFPSLYVFNAIVGCRLTFSATLRLLVGAVVVNVAVAASLGPILGFFTLSTTSYPFMVLLNVVLLAMAGFVALAFLLHTLRRLAAAPRPPAPQVTAVPVEPQAHESVEQPARPPGPLDPVPRAVPPQALGQAKFIFQIWVIIYGLVGAQMGWLLRPFIGNPHAAFQWFRPRSGNFFQSILSALQNLTGIR